MSPSDDDLNCLLQAWTAPRCPDSLETRIRRAYRDRARSRETLGLVKASPAFGGRTTGEHNRGSGMWARWIAGLVPITGKFVGVVVGAVVLLAVIARAFPQSLYLIASPAAITLDSEFLDYKDDGSYTVSEYRTSSWQAPQMRGDILDRGEAVLSRSFPGDPLRTTTEELLDPMLAISRSIARRVVSPLFYRPGRTKYWKAQAIAATDRIRNGCAPTNMWGRPMTVTGQETVLNYKTTVSQVTLEGGTRFTEWFAPGLDCVSLRSTTEKAPGDGVFRLTSERRVLRVTTNSDRAAAGEANR
jgi:hypothetical protein